MDNEEVKCEEAQTPEVKDEVPTAAKDEKCRCSGDSRTFFISLLTAVIVVLAYHGIVSLVDCISGKECEKAQQCRLMQRTGEMPPQMPGRREMHHRHERGNYGESRKEFRRPRRRMKRMPQAPAPTPAKEAEKPAAPAA